MDIKVLNDVISKFNIANGNYSFKQISQGYINDTFLVNLDGFPTYLLQRINSNVFKDVKGLHKNIIQVLNKLIADDYKRIELFSTLDENPYLLENENFSAFHRIKSDELWHHYLGESLLISVIHLNGEFEQIKLGKNLAEGEVLQAVVPAGAWFAAFFLSWPCQANPLLSLALQAICCILAVRKFILASFIMFFPPSE